MPQIESSQLHAYLLGHFHLTRAGQPMPLPCSTKARHLLAYLLLHRKQPCARLTLAGTFWPDSPEDRARHSLSHALWRIRQALPAGVISADYHALQIDENFPLWTDIESFIRLTKGQPTSDAGHQDIQQDLEQAIALYAGDLLEEVYDDWASEPREHLRTRYHHALEQLIQLEKSAGHYERALSLALRLKNSGPLHETAHQEVMRLYLALDQPQAALHQYEKYHQLLHDEIGAEPEAETIELAQATAEIVRRAGGEIPLFLPKLAPHVEDAPLFNQERPEHLPLFGRDEERAQLLTHLEAILHAPTPTDNFILVEGEAGVGKTRLMQELARDAEWRGAQVLWGHGRAMEATQPCAMLVEALTQGLTPLRAKQLAQVAAPVWLQVLGRLMPDLITYLPDLGAPPSVEPDQEQSRLVEAFIQVFTGWAQIVPLVLILEDIHWIDPDSLFIAPQLVRRIQGTRMLMLGTYRGAEARGQPAVWAGLQCLDRISVKLRLHLKRLDAAATAQLIRRSLGMHEPAELFEARVYWETRGNPLFVLETLRTLYHRGVLYRDADGDWATPFDETTQDYGELDMPRAIEQSIIKRLERLPAAALQVLQAAAVLGSEIDMDTLQATCALDTPDLLAALRILTREEILVETPRVYRFGHDKFEQMAYETIAPAQRIALHRRAAPVIATQPDAPIETLAHHYIQGEMWDEAVAHTIQAAQQAQANYANETAIIRYKRVLEMTDHLETPENRWKQHFLAYKSLGEVLKLIGRNKEALKHLYEAYALLGSPHAIEREQHQIELCRRIADVYERCGEYEQALVWLKRGLNSVDQEKFACEAVRLHYLRGWIHVRQSAFKLAKTSLKHALHLARISSARAEEAKALRALGVVAVRQSNYERANSYYEQAYEVLQELNTPEGLARLFTSKGGLYYYWEKYDQAVEHLHRACQLAETLGDRRTRNIAMSNLALVLQAQGTYAEAKAAYESVVQDSREIEDRLLQATARNNLGNFLIESGYGDHAEINDHFRHALEVFREINCRWGEAMALSSLGWLLYHMGNYEAARQASEQSLHLFYELEDHRNAGETLNYLGHALFSLDRHTEALETYRQAIQLLSDVGLQTPTLESRAGLIQVYLAQNNSAQALAETETILAHIEVHDIEDDKDPMHIYWACYQALKTTGDPRAGDVLTTAYELLQARVAGLEETARNTFLDNLTANRKVTAAYARWQDKHTSEQRTVQLPDADAPARGPLSPEQYVTVTWTVESPEDDEITGKVARRRHRILRLLQQAQAQGANPTVEDLAQALDVSSRTIDSDLAQLRREGHETPTRGHCT